MGAANLESLYPDVALSLSLFHPLSTPSNVPYVRVSISFFQKLEAQVCFQYFANLAFGVFKVAKVSGSNRANLDTMGQLTLPDPVDTEGTFLKNTTEANRQQRIHLFGR